MYTDNVFQNQGMRIKASHFEVLFSLLIGQCERDLKKKKKKKKGEQASKLEGEVFFRDSIEVVGTYLPTSHDWR